MALPGQIMDNPVTGESARWLVTEAETDGRLARCAMRVRPGGFVAAEHIHPRSEERFEVTAGTMEVVIDGRARTLRPGDRATVPPGTRHVWHNAGDDELHVVVEMEPACGFEDFIDTVFALARAGATNERGMPRPLQLAVTCRHFADSTYVANPPRWLQRIVFAVLAPLGQARGLRPVHTTQEIA
jgi:mannose-6-phosphate isomerase-like protein (cupin superfamily)